LYVKVAIPRPLEKLFDYAYDVKNGGEITKGDLVRVPFGKGTVNAVVVEVSETAPVLPEGIKLKSVKERLNSEFSVPLEILALCRFASEYYQYPLGEAYFAALPPKPETILGTREKKNYVPPTPREIILSEAQQKSLTKILEGRQKQSDAVFLLEGITGSGKTEVYIETAKQILSEGKTVLILVPEIALTAQLKDRFELGLGREIALFHSALSDGLRQTQWRKAKEGKIQVVIGARSAIFAPLPNLGLIVIDEEHDQTYKQEERFRYQARDLALYRAKQLKIPVILGSATPSLETIHRVKEGKAIHLELKERFSKNPLPTIHLASLAEEAQVGVGTLKTPIAESVVHAMQATLDRGEQILVFLNRRGYSQFILCHSCGWVKKCDRCSISMTYYHKRNELKCHVCGLRAKLPNACDTCHSLELHGMGSGTESLEEDLQLVLKDARILRLDRDQVTSQKRLEETLSNFREMKANVLIGTQMLVKGHDFPKVTCVVVLSTDALLKWPDFRASERAIQTLVQVSGRAGRAELPGNVYLQGYDLEHPVIKILTGEASREAFIESELELRKMLFYPPFSRFVRFRVEHESETEAKRFSDHLSKEAKKFIGESLESRVMGPSEALLFRAQNRYRFDLYFKAPNTDVLYKLSRKLKALAQAAEINLIIDVDPYSS
jgi:primosomal protein N' (replication factor Y)